VAAPAAAAVTGTAASGHGQTRGEGEGDIKSMCCSRNCMRMHVPDTRIHTWPRARGVAGERLSVVTVAANLVNCLIGVFAIYIYIIFLAAFVSSAG
jgi:hypothetical protein